MEIAEKLLLLDLFRIGENFVTHPVLIPANVDKELAVLNHCAVSFLSHATSNLC